MVIYYQNPFAKMFPQLDEMVNKPGPKKGFVHVAIFSFAKQCIRDSFTFVWNCWECFFINNN